MRQSLANNGAIRKLRTGEARLYREHLLRLDPESRRNRFGGAVSDEFIRHYFGMALPKTAVHGFFHDGVLRGAADLRLLASNGEAEAALSIEKDWQGRGVGTVLLECTLLAARNRRVKLLYMICLADNRRMRRLAVKFGAQLRFESGSVVAKLTVARSPADIAARCFAAGARAA